MSRFLILLLVGVLTAPVVGSADTIAYIDKKLWRVSENNSLYRTELDPLSDFTSRLDWVLVRSNVSALFANNGFLYTYNPEKQMWYRRSGLGSFKSTGLIGKLISSYSDGLVCAVSEKKTIKCLTTEGNLFSLGASGIALLENNPSRRVVNWKVKHGVEWALLDTGELYRAQINTTGPWLLVDKEVLDFTLLDGSLASLDKVVKKDSDKKNLVGSPVYAGTGIYLGYLEEFGAITVSDGGLKFSLFEKAERAVDGRLTIPPVKILEPTITPPDLSVFELVSSPVKPGDAQQQMPTIAPPTLPSQPSLAVQSLDTNNQALSKFIGLSDIAVKGIDGQDARKFLDSLDFNNRVIGEFNVADVAISNTGSIFVLNSSGDIYRWSNSQQKFKPFPGVLKKISLASDQEIWGINPLGMVVRHVKGDWKVYEDELATYIHVNHDNSVLSVDSQGRLKYFDPRKDKFFDVGLSNDIVSAVKVNSYHWVIKNTRKLYECIKNRCSYVGESAKSISSDSEGNIWIVGLDNKLKLKPYFSKSFEDVFGQSAISVEAGLFGYPWVIDPTGNLLRTKFFDRDETSDDQLALRTRKSSIDESLSLVPNKISTSGVSIVKRFRFKKVQLASGQYAASISDISDAGVNGIELILLMSNNEIQVYKSGKYKFEPFKISFSNYLGLYEFVTDITLDASGKVVLLTSRGNVLTQRAVGASTFTSESLSQSSVGSGGIGSGGIGSISKGPSPASDTELKYNSKGNLLAFWDGDLYVKEKNGEDFYKYLNGVSISDVAWGSNEFYYLNSSGQLYKSDGDYRTQLNKLPEQLTDIDSNAVGKLIAKGVSGQVYSYNSTSNIFDKISGVISPYDFSAHASGGPAYYISGSDYYIQVPN